MLSRKGAAVYTTPGGKDPLVHRLGGPWAARIYRHKSKAMEGSPLSVPDTVSLVRYGVPLLGLAPDPCALPAIPVDWAVAFLRAWPPGLLRTVEAGTGPYGTGPLAQMIAWGPDGTMAQPLWFARHLYSLATGEMLAKEHAVSWYLGRRPEGALAGISDVTIPDDPVDALRTAIART